MTTCSVGIAGMMKRATHTVALYPLAMVSYPDNDACNICADAPNAQVSMHKSQHNLKCT